MATAQTPAADPKVLKAVRTTQRLLGEHICKPPLLEKYLIKPPFRFLHDIVCNVIANTNFLKDVFPPSDLKYENVSSPEDKRIFLKKTIETIEASTGEKCTARPSKILAGKEPENTNELLHLLAKAITRSSKFNPEDSREVKGTKQARVSNDDGRKEINSEKATELKSKPKDDSDVKKHAKGHPPFNAITGKPKPGQSQAISREKQIKLVDQKKVVDRQVTAVLKPKVSVTQSAISIKNMQSKETLKPKPEVSKQKSSPSSTGLVKKPSSVNLEKSKSKTILPRKPSLSKITPILDPDLKEVSKEKSKEKLVISAPASRKNSSTGVNQDISPLIDGDDAMPPVTIEEVPLQRPVTRTKYRQGNSDGTKSNSSSKERRDGENPSQEETMSVDGEEAKQNDLEEAKNGDQLFDEEEAKNDDLLLDEEEGKNDDLLEEESRGSSSSSEDVMTEHMNAKISEWRASSAEALEKVQSFKRGWVSTSTEVEEQENESPAGNNVRSVFESEENCSVEQKDQQPLTVKSVSGAEKADDHDRPPPPQIDCNRNKPIQPLKRPVTVIMDNENDDDEDESYVVQERKESLDDLVKQNFGLVNAASDMGILSQDNRSLLVNQILETQRELENFSKSEFSDMQKELAERDQVKMREIYLKQIEDLKEAIQKITKCANPLANITQRSQDDACLMEIEFRKLRQENERLDRKLDQAKAETSRLLYPYTEELTNLDRCIDKMEGAIALAKQRLFVMDEEFSEDFIKQITQTPTPDELLEADQERSSSNPLWGGIPHADVVRDDEEYELKMRNTSLRKVFQLAVNMHEGAADNYNGFSYHPGQLQGSNLVRLSNQSMHRQNPFGRANNMDGSSSNLVSDFFGGRGYAGGKVSTKPGSQVRQKGHQYQPQQQHQQRFGFDGGPQQYQQREPQVETEIRPTWWD